MIKKIVLASLSCLLLGLPLLYWLNRIAAFPRQEPVQTLTQYVRFLYARDFRQAYRFISAEDQRLKKSDDYVRERQPFTGFALDVARKLAGLIEIHPLSSTTDDQHNRLRVAMKLPDANSVAPLLHDWDDKRLNTLSATERKKILATIDNWAGAMKLPMIEGEENFVMVKEGSKWKVFLDWAAGAQVQFAATLPAGNEISAAPTTKETVARSGDTFTIGFKVTNPTTKEVMTRIIHRVEPKELAPYLDLVECALLLPVRVQPGEEQLFNSTYLVRGDLPDGAKTLKVTYEFKVESN
jgi:hypothetical protein